MECEMYKLNNGDYQCGNCGHVTNEIVKECSKCGAKVTTIVDEGEADDTFWESDYE